MPEVTHVPVPVLVPMAVAPAAQAAPVAEPKARKAKASPLPAPFDGVTGIQGTVEGVSLTVPAARVEVIAALLIEQGWECTKTSCGTYVCDNEPYREARNIPIELLVEPQGDNVRVHFIDGNGCL